MFDDLKTILNKNNNSNNNESDSNNKNENENENENVNENENENVNENENENENESGNENESDNENEKDGYNYEIRQLNDWFKKIDQTKSLEEQVWKMYRDGLGVKNISGLVVNEIQGTYEKK